MSTGVRKSFLFVDLRHLATRVAFFIAGLAISAWAPLVPFVKSRLDVSEGSLGLLLLCLGAGSIISMPLAGPLVARWGSRRIICLSYLAIAVTLPALAVIDNVIEGGFALLAFGASMGAADIAINVQASELERLNNSKLMSGFHGLYSIGCLCGSALVGSVLWLGASPLSGALVAACVILVSTILFGRHLPNAPTKHDGPLLVLPRGTVLFLGLMCFSALLVEGAMLDWSALILITDKSVEPSRAGIGYTCFAVAMSAARLGGDWTAQRLGERTNVALGALLAAIGIWVVAFAPGPRIAVAGFVLLGIGCSNIIPLLYSAAGKQRAMQPSRAIGAVATLGYAGGLAGPAIIGFVAHATSLVTAFSLLGGLLMLIACGYRAIPESVKH
jgi:MFS family permease